MIRQLSLRILNPTGISKYARAFSHWKQYEMGPPDPIVGLNEAYALDKSPNKVNVGVGAYRGDDGLPFVLPCVKEAEQINIQNSALDHEYLGIVGDTAFVRLALAFVYGSDSSVLKKGRVAGVQTISGTGGLRVFGELLKRGGHKEIYVVSTSICANDFDASIICLSLSISLFSVWIFFFVSQILHGVITSQL